MVKTVLNIGLLLVAIGMAYYLYRIIQEPIEFEQAFEQRETAVINNLKDIRTLQRTYFKIHGKYASNFEALVHMYKNENMMTIAPSGDVNDTSIVVTYDTTMEAVSDVVQLLQKPFNIDELAYIPYTDNKHKFGIQAGELDKQKVKIQVFQIDAPKKHYLAGLNPDYVRYKKDYKVGSLSEGNDAGNWE